MAQSQCSPKRIEDAEYARLGQFVDPDRTDGSEGAEQAYFRGVDFYLATDAVRQPLPDFDLLRESPWAAASRYPAI